MEKLLMCPVMMHLNEAIYVELHSTVNNLHTDQVMSYPANNLEFWKQTQWANFICRPDFEGLSEFLSKVVKKSLTV